MPFEVGEIYIYKKTGKAYEISGLCMVKTHDPMKENGWSKSVMYRPKIETLMQQSLYVRTIEEFSELFFKASN